MFGLRMPELLIIGFIVVLLFGASKLPALGQGLGEGIRGFKKAFGGEDDKKEEKKDDGKMDDDKTPKA
jgi:sec-independent protein translocase protein TatA